MIPSGGLGVRPRGENRGSELEGAPAARQGLGVKRLTLRKQSPYRRSRRRQHLRLRECALSMSVCIHSSPSSKTQAAPSPNLLRTFRKTLSTALTPKLLHFQNRGSFQLRAGFLSKQWQPRGPAYEDSQELARIPAVSTKRSVASSKLLSCFASSFNTKVSTKCFSKVLLKNTQLSLNAQASFICVCSNTV